MHLHLDLSKDTDKQDTMRPRLSTWHDYDDDIKGEKCVVLCVGAAWGASQRFINMTPSEARQLARIIVRTAEQADHVEIGNAA